MSEHRRATGRGTAKKHFPIDMTLSPLSDGTHEVSRLKIGDPNKRYWHKDERGHICWEAHDEVITLPDGVSVVGRLYCPNLGEVVLPPSVRVLGDLCFGAEFYTGDTYEWYALHTVHFSQGLTCICYRAFCNCRNLDGVHLPKGLTEIEEEAFLLCLSLSRITIPESVEEIGHRAFGKCRSLREVIFRDGIRSTGSSTFIDNESLARVILPKTLIRIGSGCFAGCRSLAAIEIPESVREIGKGAFRGCTALSSFTFRRDLENAEEMRTLSPFDGCPTLTEFHIDAACRRADWIPAAPALTAIHAAPDHPLFVTVDGALYTKDGKTLLRVPTGLTGSFTVPRGVRAIAPYAFSGCAALTAIHLPSTLRTIGDGAFLGCTALEDAKLPARLTSVGEDIFEGCTALKTNT